MNYELIEARENAGQSRMQAADEIGCGVTLLFEMEKNGTEPRQRAIAKNVKRYIKKYTK